MSICPKCKCQVENNASFCPNCGLRFAPQPVQNGAASAAPNANMYPQHQQQTVPPTYAPSNQQPVRNGAASAAPNANMYPQHQQQTVPPTYAASNQPGTPQAAMPYQHGGPVAQLKTNRSFIKTLLLSLITFGIYGLICYGHITDDVNLVCSRYDGRKSMNYYLLFFLVGPFTAGIAAIVWMHNICDRIGNELKRRQIAYSFGAKDFWLWGVLGTFIIVGPFIFAHKFFKSVNMMNESFNQIG